MTYSNPILWIMILLVGLGTFALRGSSILLSSKTKRPQWLERILRFVPAAVLAAIISSSLFIGDDKSLHLGNHRLGASLLATFVALKTKSMLWTIISGMTALWLLSYIGSL